MDKEDFFVTMVSRKRWRRRRHHYSEEFVIDRYEMVKRGSAFGTHLYATSDQEVFIHDTFNDRKDWAWKRTYKRYTQWIRERGDD